MKRLFLLSAVAVFLAACNDSQVPSLADPEGPNLNVMDGAHEACDSGPCEHFFFMPPLVPTPNPTGTFNSVLKPHIIVTTLPFLSDGVTPADTSLACVTTGAQVAEFLTSEITADVTNEIYSVGWQTGASNLTAGTGYRICVKLGSIDLGFRDVQPDENGADVPRNPEQLPILEFNNGSNLPIKFRIESGILCNNDDDCGEGSVGTGGGQVVTNTLRAGIDVSGGLVTGDVNLIIERVNCPVTDGRVTFLPLDIPQFAGCYDVRTAEDNVTFANPGTIVGVCLDIAAATAAGLTDDQVDRLQLHHRRTSDEVVEALRSTAAPFVDCLNFVGMGSDNKLVRFARRGLRAVQSVLAPWFSPPPVAAFDNGFGGGGFRPGSPLVWALPSQMEIVDGLSDGFGKVGEASEPAPQVLVTDAGGDPVPGATVRFDITLPTSDALGSVVTGTDGIATVNWILGSNPNALDASGVGIGLGIPAQGTHLQRSPPGGSGVFADHVNNLVELGTGVLKFTATACDPSTVQVSVDGSIGVSEYPNDTAFIANISGGDAPATLYWANDCDNLYLAVEVERDAADKINILRFDFDNDNDGAPDAGDDVLVFNGDVGGFSDMFLTANCLKKKQSSCGEEDPISNGSGEQVFDGTSLSVYEVSHPLKSGDAAHDFQLDFGDTVGMFLTLSLGKGAQGNTQVPGFRVYLPITITIPGATP